MGRLVLALVVLLGCGDGTPPATSSSPYTATVDLSALIQQLGAELQADEDEAVEQLASYGERAVPALVQAATHERRDIRVNAVDTLSQIDSPKAVAALVDIAAHDDDAETRATALLKLAENSRTEGRPS